jgi:hypothetical protein
VQTDGLIRISRLGGRIRSPLFAQNLKRGSPSWFC